MLDQPSNAKTQKRELSLEKLRDHLTQGDDLQGVSISFGRSLGWSPVWAATISADEDLLIALLAEDGPLVCRGQVNERNHESGCCPLHCAMKFRLLDAVRALIHAGADVNSKNSDLFGLGASGFRLLPECGGQGALHLLCAMKEDSETIEICDLLLAARADVELEDNLCLKPIDIARAHNNLDTAGILVRHGAASEDGKRIGRSEIRELCKARETQWREQRVSERRVERQKMLQYLRASYHPKHPHFYDPAFFANAARHALSTKQPTQICPGVFCVGGLFPPELCEALVDELDSFSKWASDTGFAVARPNSMNRYGMVLGDIGFHESMHRFMQTVIASLASEIFPSVFRSDSCDPDRHLKSQHSFIVRYRVGEDEDLKTHRDDSDITLNVCLGRQFEGAHVYFHSSPSCVAVSSDRVAEQLNAADEYAYPHPSDCKFCTFSHRHTPGTALLHLGRHVHGVDRLMSGERVNLIVWCRFRSYPPELQP